MTEDITDYGAEPNPDDPDLASARRNVEAIWNAAEAAGEGGTIYVPEGTYYVGQEERSRIIRFGGTEPAGISWVGDGPTKSTIGLSEHMDKDDTSHVLMYYMDGAHGTVTFEDIQFYGNADNLDGLKTGDTTRTSNCFRTDGSTGTLELSNVKMEGWVDSGVKPLSSWDIIADRCTWFECGAKARMDGYSGHALSVRGDATFTNCRFRRAGSYILNITSGSGHIYLENCYVKGYGNGLFKMSSGDTYELKNTYVEANTEWIEDNFPDHSDPSDEFHGRNWLDCYLDDNGIRKTVILRDVEFRNCTQEGIRARRPLELDAHNVAIHNANMDGTGEAGISAQGSQGDLVCNMAGQEISIHGTNGEAIDVRSDATGTGTIGTLYRDGNTDGLGSLNDITIDTDNDGGTPLSPDTPSEDETGINSSSGDDGDTDNGETDDGSTEQDDPIFDDWTPQWESTQSDWSTNSTSSNVEDAVLELDASTSGRHALSIDDVGSATDVDMVGLVRVPSNDDSSSSWCRLIGRGAGTAGDETGYFVAIRDVPQFEIDKYVNGNSRKLDSQTVSDPVGTWLYIRFNIEGENLRARYWEYGNDEPSDWDLETTDADVTDSGWVGTGGWSTDLQQFDYISVAVGGETAPLPGGDSSPTVSWETPETGTTVDGTVAVQVDASDSEDANDSLTVKYRIDDGSWRSVEYNADTGYYEDDWDTTSTSDGDHTLEASVTDSSGNGASTSVSVTTENSGSAPAVDQLSLSEVESSNSDAEFDAEWQVSDSDGDLDSVDLVLMDDSDDSTEDTATVSGSGDTASSTTRLVASGDDGSGNSYTVELQVADGAGNTASETATITESEESGSAPIVNRFNVSEAGRPDPHAEITVLWDVTDEDGDLATVDIDIADGDGTVQGVNWTLDGSTASDTDSFKIKNGDGKSYDVTFTVTDETGLSTTETKSVSA